MQVIESLPDGFVEERMVRQLADAEGVRATIPLVSVEKIDARPATFGGEQIAAFYLHVDDTKYILAHHQNDGEWRVVDSRTDVVVQTHAGEFDVTEAELHDVIRAGLPDPEAVRIGTIETTHPGHPYVEE